MSSWNIFNSILIGFKKFPVFRLLYKISWAPRVYHLTLAFIGAVIYRFPSRKIVVIGITGTKGKSSVLELINAILEGAGERTALMSSIRVKAGDRSIENVSGNTQLGRFFIQYFLRDAVRSKCKYALVEVTSEGVVLSRHRFIKWSAALITNIAPEHIESHGSFENYREAKLTFLKYAAKRGATIFVNGDNEASRYFLEKLGDVGATQYSVGDLENLSKEAREALPGSFNKENIAGAVAVAHTLGVNDSAVGRALEAFSGVPGRMDFVQREPFAVVVDYAHTPDSLEAVYRNLSGNGGLICVLGSAGGGRDKWKRPRLGEIASRYCRKIVLTDEDPFDEDPLDIVNDIKKGISGGYGNVTETLDRKEAIYSAINSANKGDTVVITGKGSESYIRVAGGRRIPWSDRDVSREALASRS